MKNNATIYICLTTLVFLLAAPLSITNACWHEPEFYGYAFWKPNVINTEEFNDYLVSFKSLADYDHEAYERQEKDNITEWRESVCQVATEEDVAFFVYKATSEQVDSVLRIAEGESFSLPETLVGNSFVEHLVEAKCIETLEYLGYAKDCEPHVTATYYWEEKKKDEGEMKALLKQGKKTIKSTKSDYIKLRYVYQVIRLAHYLGEFEECADLYDKYIPKLAKKSKSIIINWATAHKAGALKSIGDKTEAAYLFSRVFENSPSKREAAYRSFEVNNDQEWKGVLKLCQNKEEEANLYFLRGIDVSSIATEEMRKIYEIAPNSPKLEVLLVREIQKLESDLLGRDFLETSEFDTEYYGFPREEAEEYILEVGELVGRIVTEGKVKNKDLWQLAQGYLEYLEGDLEGAKSTFATVKSSTQNSKIKRQLEAFELAVQVSAIKTMTPSIEEEIYQIFTQKKDLLKEFPDFKGFMNDKLNAVYKKQKDLAKAYLCKPDIWSLKTKNDLKTIEGLIALGKKSNRNNFEKLLLDDKLLNTFIEMKGTAQLASYNLDEALKTFKELPNNHSFEGKFDPFEESIKDCNNCAPNKNATLYNKLTLTEKLIQLRAKATQDTTDYQSAYQLGLAFYNMTYYGTAWNAASYYRSSGSYMLSDYLDRTYGTNGNYNIQPALIAFQQAIDRAAGPEFAAKATFWAAKCQLIKYYTAPESKEYDQWKGEAPIMSEKFTTYYAQLDENFSNTDYYNQVLKECAFFYVYTQQ